MWELPVSIRRHRGCMKEAAGGCAFFISSEGRLAVPARDCLLIRIIALRLKRDLEKKQIGKAGCSFGGGFLRLFLLFRQNISMRCGIETMHTGLSRWHLFL